MWFRFTLLIESLGPTILRMRFTPTTLKTLWQDDPEPRVYKRG